MAPPSRKSQPKYLRNPSRKAAISKGNLRSRTGGGISFRKEEKDKIGSIFDKEIEADRRSAEKRKKVQKRNQSVEDGLGSLVGDGIKGKLPRFSNRITLKMLRRQDPLLREKLNLWVAYFNLENEYGKPPEDAVTKIFQKALQYCDPKEVHLALLGMYQRTEQHKLAIELLDKMARKFKHSCKVWLSRIQSLLKQNSDGIQSVVNRVLLSLPRHNHIKFLSQTVILEFKCGVPDRGRSCLRECSC